MRLYHITPASNLLGILKHGLQPRPGGTFKDPEVGSDEARIYLTEDLEDVLSHALKYVGDWAVLEIEVEDSGLHPDLYEEGHYYLTRRVPQSNIQVIGIYHSK